MLSESRKVVVFALVVVLLLGLIIPAMSPLPMVNNATPSEPLLTTYVEMFSSDRTEPIYDMLDGVLRDVARYYLGDAVIFMDILVKAMGLLLALYLIGAVLLITNKGTGVMSFIRFISVLNTLVYGGFIATIIHQNNEIGSYLYGLVGNVFRIAPATGAYVGLIISVVLVFSAKKDTDEVNVPSNYRPEPVTHVYSEETSPTNKVTSAPKVSEAVSASTEAVKEKVSFLASNEKERVAKEYKEAEKTFKNATLEDVLSAIRELCYKHPILKRVMPYTKVLLTIHMLIFFVICNTAPYSIIICGIAPMVFALVCVLSISKGEYASPMFFAGAQALFKIFLLLGDFGITTVSIGLDLIVLIPIVLYSGKRYLANRKAATVSTPKIMCKHCGAVLKEDSKFCQSCGNPTNS